MNDDTPDWRDGQPTDDARDRERSTARGSDRRSADPRFTDTRLSPGPGGGEAPPRASRARERMSADYDDEPVFRRRKESAGLSALLGSDAMTRKLVYGAAGLGAVLVLGVGGWSLFGARSHGIPVIGPPPGAVRDRPADPGGMQIMADGTDLDVTGHGEAHLAPAPEQPRPEALAARQAANGQPAQGAPSRAGETAAPDMPSSGPQPAGTPGAGSGTAGEAGTGPVSDAPTAEMSSGRQSSGVTTPPAPAREADPEEPHSGAAGQDGSTSGGKAPSRMTDPDAASRAAPRSSQDRSSQAQTSRAQSPAGQSGGHMIQLAALGSEADARATWSRLSRQAGDLLSGRSPVIEHKVINGRNFYRLRLGGFDSLQAARAFCVRLHARSIACTPAVF